MSVVYKLEFIVKIWGKRQKGKRKKERKKKLAEKIR